MNSARNHPSLPRPIVGQMKLENSNRLWAEAKRLVPGATQSLMKRPEMFAPGSFPVFLTKGQGALVEDADGQQFIDFISGLGANMLGHNHPDVVEPIRRHLEEGVLHSLPTPVEVSSAQALVDMIPGAEMVRFFKTGADATSAAVRLARYITRKERIITVGYNGWHDHFMFDTPGVPAALAGLTTRMPLFTEPDEAALLTCIEQNAKQLALVLLSVPYNRVLSKEFMHKVRATCSAHEVLFVLDEVVTGFRLAPGGAQEFFDVRADFVCLSKSIAAGMPLSAIAGPERHLTRLNDLQVSTTFGGELLSLAVCESVLKGYRKSGYVEHIAKLGRQLRAGINAKAEQLGSPLRVLGYDAIPFFLFDKNPAEHAKKMQPFQAGMAQRGVLLRRDVNFICAAHTAEQIDYTIEMAGEVLRSLTPGSTASAA
ncbi:myxochelin B biosynthesis transaminase MxcL [Pyxidicoccus fallax]|uniref:Aminotransferase class III-fold pyridoxal phosphate-dependent enzyme n=1 Tax=Pyxidicoccus fallax TaxID=394095 RepID=A0A848LLV0_9BACT|nr:myxochelin B biosynthesis transaminase MxcL [Pyxidicoccus fallax]NMO18691.1 aminotransferase class III-fold pyridoxal phosphate-dependent enzyme [Pyxidicoccus fallax]NPC79142.1 myxochelin B biosynthesis transaminase MxcL [Pyxidicoccus fallax]